MIETAPHTMNGSASKARTVDKSAQLRDLIARRTVDLSIVAEQPPSLLTMHGEPVLTEGSMSCLRGAPKARKSFLATLLVSRYLRPDLETETGDGLRGVDSGHKRRVLILDTEQASYYVNRAWRRVTALVGPENAKRLHVIQGRGIQADDLLGMLRVYMQDHGSEVGLVVVDHVADLVKTVLDDEGSKRVIETLDWVGAEYPHVHIITVSHVNRSNSNSSGWIGHMVEKRSESVLHVEKIDSERSTVEPAYTRGAGYDSFTMVIKDGLPYVGKHVPKSEQAKPRAPEFHHLDFAQHERIVTEAFAGAEQLSTKQFTDRITNVIQKLHCEDGVQFGGRKASQFVEGYVMHGYVIDVSGEGKKQPRYAPNPDRVKEQRAEGAQANPITWPDDLTDNAYTTDNNQ